MEVLDDLARRRVRGVPDLPGEYETKRDGERALQASKQRTYPLEA